MPPRRTPAERATLPASSSSPLLSICIPTRDRLDLLLACLDSLARTCSGWPIEVVLGDTGSRPETVEAYRNLGLPFISVPGPFNFSRVCNAMARATRGRQILFLNNDTEALSRDWVERLLQEPDRKIVGACLVYPTTRRIQSAGIEVVRSRRWPQRDVYRPRLGRGDEIGLALRNVDLGSRVDAAPRNPRPVMAVTGAFLATPRALFESLGGFDEAYRVDLQDIDLCLRARARGSQVVCRRDIVFAHHHSGTRRRYRFPLDDWRRLGGRWRRELEAWGPAVASGI